MKNLILYFTLGYPDNDTLQSFLSKMENEVDYVEFGFPSKNPVYDGPTIRRTHSSAIGNFNEDFYEPIFQTIRKNGLRMYSLSYFSDLEHNFSEFVRYLKDNGFSGMIIPDLLIDYPERVGEAIETLKQQSLEYIPFFTASTPDRIVKEIADRTGSWIYYGLQPSTGINVPYSVSDVSSRIRELLPDREINFGFGIRSTEDIELLIENGADGVAIGSLLVNYLEKRDVEGFVDFVNKSRGVIDGIQTN